MQTFNEYHAEKAAIDLSVGEVNNGGDWTYTAVCEAHMSQRCRHDRAESFGETCLRYAIKINDEHGQFVAWW
tara:strand:- start:300 stop:515 length:216 start_codon:yes stop_codon:yes gene_type:complete